MLRAVFVAAFLTMLVLVSAPVVINPLVDELETRIPAGTDCPSNLPIVVLAAGVDRRASDAQLMFDRHVPLRLLCEM